MAVVTPTSAKLAQINAGASVTLIDVPSGGGGSGPRGLFSGILSPTAPTVANTGLSGWYNQSSSSVVELPHALMVSSPGTVSGVSGITGAVTSGSPITALVCLGRRQNTNYPALSLGFSDGVKFHGIALYWSPSVSRMLASVERRSDPNTQVTASPPIDYIGYSGQIWLRYRRAAGMVYWECSDSGASWRKIYSEPESGLYLSDYTTLLFGAGTSGGIACDAVLHSLSVG